MRKTLYLVSLLGALGLHNSCGNTKSAGSSGSAGSTGAGGSAGTGSAGTNGAAGATGVAGNDGGAGTTGAAGATDGGDADTTGAAGSDAGDAGDAALAVCGDDQSTGSGAGCNTLAASGPCVIETISAGTAPTPAGGTIVAGTYNLTSTTFFGSADAGNQQGDRRATLRPSAVTATSFMLDQVEVSGTHVDISTGTVTVSGTTVSYTPTCPAPGDGGGDQGGSASFTATPTAFTLIQSKNGGTTVDVYTKL